MVNESMKGSKQRDEWTDRQEERWRDGMGDCSEQPLLVQALDETG